MIPDSWFAIASFFVLAAPGLLLDQLAVKRRVRAAESALRESGRVVLASVSFSAAGLAAAAGLALLAPDVIMAPDVIAFGSRPELEAAPGSAAATAAVVLAVSLGSVWAIDRLRRRAEGATLSGQSAWRQVLREDLPERHYAVARVRLQTGPTLTGRVRSYTADFEVADRELVLSPPLFSQVGDSMPEPLPAGWQRLVVHGSQVVSMSVAYVPIPDADNAVSGPAATT